MNKFKILAVVLFVLALGAAVLGAERWSVVSDNMEIVTYNEEQSAKLESEGDLEGAAQQLEWAAETLSYANDAKAIAYPAFGGAVVLLIAGAIVWRKGAKA